MFGPSRTAAYAIQAMVCLARHPEGVRGTERIGRCAGVPRAYLVKVLNALAHDGLVATKRGYRGGYRLARGADRITLHDIVAAVDGPDVFGRCLLGLGRCSAERACPVHPVWSVQRPLLEKRYRELNLSELAKFPRWRQDRDYGFGARRQVPRGA